MTKDELIAKIAEKADLTTKASKDALNATLEAISESLQEGEKVQLVGFGTFDVKERPERQGLNPRTKEPITIAAAKVPSFKPGKGLKDSVNGD